MKRWIFGAVAWVCLLMSAVIPTVRATDALPVVVYRQNNLLITVDGNGIQNTYELYEAESYGYIIDIAISDDGRLGAYCLNAYEEAASQTLFVLDFLSGGITFSVSLPYLCTVGRDAFSPDNQFIAVGLASTDWGFDTGIPNLAWSFQIYNLNTGALTTELGPYMFDGFGLDEQFPHMAIVRNFFDSDTIVLSLHPIYFEGPMPDGTAVVVNLATLSVSPANSNLARVNAAYYIGASEMAFVASDSRLPATDFEMMYMPKYNAVYLDDVDGERLVYHTADYLIDSVTFSLDGSELLIYLLKGDNNNFDNPFAYEVYQTTLRRDGTSTPPVFVGENAPRLLWSSFLGYSMGYPTFKGTTVNATTCPGALVSRLSVGGFGVVTPGQANNVRAQSSVSGSRLGTIPAGGRFDVLEGPVCSDGYAWWRVRYGTLTGWTAESNDQYYFLAPSN